MKALPKRKGNPHSEATRAVLISSLNESPSEKEGKYPHQQNEDRERESLNESPSEKEGKFLRIDVEYRSINGGLNESPSEKEGKSTHPTRESGSNSGLNESPSEKEGKSPQNLPAIGPKAMPQ